MIKLIASDMDGTLLNSKHTISEENIKAIREAQSKGVHFTIVTGRDYSGVEPFVKEFGLECEYIVMNGAEYRDRSGKVIESIPLKDEQVKKIVGFIRKENLYIELFTNKGLFIIDYDTFNNELLNRVRMFSPKATPEEIEIFKTDWLNTLKIQKINEFEDIVDEDIKIFKIITFNMDTELISKLKSEINTIDGLAVASTFSNDIEITNEEAQKGKILAKVIEKMGIKKEEVIVLGDSFNDYSMFSEFPNSFAMENAIPEIKEIAKYVTDSNDNHGVAKAIYKVI